MVKRHMSTPVLKRKNYPGSQIPKNLVGVKKYITKPCFKN